MRGQRTSRAGRHGTAGPGEGIPVGVRPGADGRGDEGPEGCVSCFARKEFAAFARQRGWSGMCGGRSCRPSSPPGARWPSFTSVASSRAARDNTQREHVVVAGRRDRRPRPGRRWPTDGRIRSGRGRAALGVLRHGLAMRRADPRPRRRACGSRGAWGGRRAEALDHAGVAHGVVARLRAAIRDHATLWLLEPFGAGEEVASTRRGCAAASLPRASRRSRAPPGRSHRRGSRSASRPGRTMRARGWQALASCRDARVCASRAPWEGWSGRRVQMWGPPCGVAAQAWPQARRWQGGGSRRLDASGLRAGQGRAGQGRAGQGRAGQGRAGQGRAGQGRAGQGRAGQGRAGQGRAGQGRAGQGRAGQGRAGQGRAGQGRAGQGRAAAEAEESESRSPGWGVPPGGAGL
jgi:hypothetical protein